MKIALKLISGTLFCFAVFLFAANAQGKKESVDLLVRNAMIVTMDGERHVYENGAMAIKGDSIVAIGPSAEILAKYDGSQKLDAAGKANHPRTDQWTHAHCHGVDARTDR